MRVSNMRASILFLANTYPDFDSSYRGHFIKEMAVRLQRNGYKIIIVTPKVFKMSHYFEEHECIKVYRFPFFTKNKLLIEYEKIPYVRMILYYLSGLIITLYVMAKYNCDLIHTHWAIPTGLISVFAGAILKRPFIVTIHGSDLRMAISNPFLLKVFLYVCKRSKHITCVSEVQKREIEQLGIKENKISVFPMCIDEDFLEVGKIKKRRLERRPFIILSNRNLLPIYNVSVLIRAIPIVLEEEPNIKFLIAGDGPERDYLEKEAKRLNINSSTQFLGRIPHEEMPNLFSQADVYVSTSLYDGTSVSLLEAMGSGTFPIVTDVPANREWIIHGANGFLIPTNEEEFLANRIIDAVHDQTLLEKSIAKNLSIVEEKALWRVSIERVSEVYKEFLSFKN
jgi:glycosyltransferase involved in cell wall biosynthesis